MKQLRLVSIVIISVGTRPTIGEKRMSTKIKEAKIISIHNNGDKFYCLASDAKIYEWSLQEADWVLYENIDYDE